MDDADTDGEVPGASTKSVDCDRLQAAKPPGPPFLVHRPIILADKAA